MQAVTESDGRAAGQRSVRRSGGHRSVRRSSLIALSFGLPRGAQDTRALGDDETRAEPSAGFVSCTHKLPGKFPYTVMVL